MRISREIIKRAICDVDPVGFVSIGLPEEEYSLEIDRIHGTIKEKDSFYRIGSVVYNTFSHYFDPIEVPYELCSEIAHKIYSAKTS